MYVRGVEGMKELKDLQSKHKSIASACFKRSCAMLLRVVVRTKKSQRKKIWVRDSADREW